MSAQPTVAEMARATAEALSDPRAWCRGRLAAFDNGVATLIDHPEAKRFCASGHCQRLFGFVAFEHMRNAYVRRFGCYPSENNDCQGREYVRERLIELADELEAEPKP